VALHTQLKNYVTNVLSDPKFVKLKGLSNLCAKLVETNKCKQWGMLVRLFDLRVFVFLTQSHENSICQLKKIHLVCVIISLKF